MRVCVLSWRDTGHPDAGGSEVFVHEIGRRLVAAGHEVTLVTARPAGSDRDDVHDGVHVRRRGGRLTVYLHGLRYLLSREGRRADAVVEVINGLPFGARLVRRRGLVGVVHHLHRTQWELIYPGPKGRLGWWVESRLTPALYRTTPLVTVSEASRRDLVDLGFRDVTVVHNGTGSVPLGLEPADPPRLCVLARLVPHKRIEHAFEVLRDLRDERPDLRLDVIGEGWWAAELVASAEALGVADLVTWHGHVPDHVRDTLLGRASIALLPSTREGWGLSIVEAGLQGTPTIAYRDAGGVTESVVDGVTGLLVTDRDGMTDGVRALLDDRERLAAMSAAARRHATAYDWDDAATTFTAVLRQARGRTRAEG